MKRVLISVSNDINNDQRLYRTCTTLQEENYDTLVIGRLKKGSTKTNLPFKTKRLRMIFSSGFLFYKFFNLRLFFLLLFLEKDILYANDLDTLLPNFLVSRIQRKTLIFDSHELFSEVPELQNRPFTKKIWKFLEDWMIPKLKNVITVSDGIKDYYQDEYNIDVTLVRNVPITQNVQKKELDNIPKKQKIIWYQGSVNVGRGLELMIETIPFLYDYVFVIAGDGDILQELEQKVLNLELENKVSFLGKLPPSELKKLTHNGTVGISLEEDLGLNYRFTLPNKLFDYIHGEIPVIVSNLPEMASLVSQYKIGEILEDRNPKALSELILNMASKDYSKQLSKAKKQLNWSTERVQLVNLLKTAI